jgi:hypothetical protein
MKAVVFALSLAVSAQALATDPVSPTSSALQASKPDAIAIDAALRMLEAQEFDLQVINTIEVMVEGMMAAQIEQLQNNSEEPIPAELLTSFRRTMRDHASGTMKAKMPDMMRQTAEIYAREFTVAELQRLAEIAADPVSVKTRAKGQALSSQLMMVGMNAMRESQDELKVKIEQMVHDYLEKAGLENDEKS